MQRLIRKTKMKIKNGRLIFKKSAADSGFAIRSGSRTASNKIKTIIMLKAVIRYLNFNGNTPIIIHRYGINDKINLRLSQRYNSRREVE